MSEALAIPLDQGDVLAHYCVRDEDQHFERKSGLTQGKDIARALVALANAEGGTLFVGARSGELAPVPRSRVNELRQVAITLTSPPVRARVNEIPVPGDDGQVCLVYAVDPGETVHETTSGDCFLRVGDSSHKLDFLQRRELGFDRSAGSFDGEGANVGVDELDPTQTEAYRHALDQPSVEDMLNARSLRARDGSLTVAAALLFMSRPQDRYPNAHVRVLRYRGSERGTGARLEVLEGFDERVEGSLPVQVVQAADLIEQWIPKRTALSRAGTFDPQPIIPRDAWLEGLVNAVVHRSYSISGDHIRVEIFSDRIEIMSPGRFPGLVNPSKPLEIARHARNPRIARVMSDLRITREMGEGIRRIYEEMRRSGLTAPLYTQSAQAVQLILSSHDALPDEVRDELSKSARLVLDEMRRAAVPLGTGQIAQATGVTRPTAIRAVRQLQDLGLVVWEGESGKDPRATWRLT